MIDRLERDSRVAQLAFAALMAATVAIGGARADENADQLVKQTANPISSLISVPFQGNYNGGIGPGGAGQQFYINFQPVIPFKLNEGWKSG